MYEARRGDDAAVVALKVPEVSRARGLARFRREIRLLGRLRHPGIIRLIEYSTHCDPLWYAMPLIGGQTLEEHIEHGPAYANDRLRDVMRARASTSTARDIRLAQILSINMTGAGATSPALERLRGLGFELAEQLDCGSAELVDSAPDERCVFELDAVRGALECVSLVCQTLAYMHGEEVVHRDIKPSNIVLTDEGCPVLLDFGLAAEFGPRSHADQIDAVGLRDGTVRYTSPEQISGELVDVRADFYAIGCILYEILTGATPFEHKDPVVTLIRHVGVQPRPLDHVVAGIPEELSSLVSSLLAKDPIDRPGHACAIVDVLSRLTAGESWEGGPEPKPYLFVPRFIGHERIIERARASLLCAGMHLGASMEVVGAGGVGKTRLATEVVRIARMRAVVVASGCCVSADSSGLTRASGPPLHLFGGVLTQIADELRVTSRAPFPPAHLATLAHFCPELLLGAGELEPKECTAREELFEALEQGLDWLCEEGTLLLVLDDMQWADELSWSAARYLSERASQKRWVVMELTRPSERSSGALTQRYELGPISQSDVRVMVEQVLGARSVPDALVEHVITQSGCVPLVVSESLRLLVDCGVLQRTRHGAWMLDLDPEQLEEVASEHAGPSSMIRARLAALGARAARVAAAGALLGRAFTTDLLLDLLDSREDSEEALDAQLGVLADAGVLLERDQDVVFCHDLVRQAAYELLGEAERVRFHARAAELLGALSRPDWLEVAYHWVSAGDRSRAALAYLDAGRAYVEQAAYLDARHAFETAELIAPERMLRARAEFERGWLIHRRKRMFAEVVPVLDALHERFVRDGVLLGELEFELELCAARAECARQMEQLERALELVDEGLARARGHDTPKVMSRLASLKVIEANCFYLRGELDRSLDVYEVARALFGELEDKMGEGVVLSNIGNIRRRRGEFERARACYERALSLFEAISSRRMKYVVLGNLGNVRRDLGDLTGAICALERCAEVHEADSNRRALALVSTNLGRLYMETGALREADELLSRSLEVSRELGIGRRIGTALLYSGLLACRRSEFTVAEGQLRESIECFEGCDEVRSLWTSRSSLLEFLCGRGRFDEYRVLRERWVGELGQLDDTRFLTGQLAELAGQCALYEERFEVASREFDFAAGVYAGLKANVRQLVALAWGVHARLAVGDASVQGRVERVYEVAARLPEVAGESAAALARLERALQARELYVGLAREDHPMSKTQCFA